jgi:uncharacterized protein (TIGR02391 family)
MAAIEPFSESVIESLAKVLGECGTGSEVSGILKRCGIPDSSVESTKWRRLNSIFSTIQREDACANRVVAFLQTMMEPARWIGRVDNFTARRIEVNTVLAFCGLSLEEDGKLRQVGAATTLTDAEARARTLRARLQGRRIHAEVFRYCRAELLQENFFHAVFEAAKGLAQRIRDLSGVQADGAALIDAVFAVDRPILAFNSLRTETEKSDHKGLAMLLKGCFAAVRNRLAHEPKLLWEGEEDAADYLSLISLLHRKLDDAVRTGV